MSPSGKYVLIMWGRGAERFKGLEAYHRATMAYAGKVTASSGHGDVIQGDDGQEYYVCTNANNAYFLTDAHFLTRSRIPKGVVFNPGGEKKGDVDYVNTVATGATVPLLAIDW